jgi:hypothetical protein
MAFWLVIAGCGVAFAWLVAPHVRQQLARRRLAQHVTQLRLGMTTGEVTQAMGRSPDCIVLVNGASVVYYGASPGDVREWPVCLTRDPQATAWAHLPVVYAAAEVAFDSSGKAVAYGFCGEGVGVALHGKPANCMRFLAGDARPN